MRYNQELALRRAGAYTVVYGAFAALPLFLIWLFLVWLIVLAAAVLTASHGQVLDQPERCSAGSPSCIEAGSDQGGGWLPAPAPGPCGCAFHTEGSGGDHGNGGGVAGDPAGVPVAVGGPT